MAKLPQIKKKISAFLTREEGSISKQKLVKTGILLSAVAIGSLESVKGSSTYDPDCPGVVAPKGGSVHSDDLGIVYDGQKVTGTHNHCVETHTNHSQGGGGGWW